MNVSAYKGLLKELGFTTVEAETKLQHPSRPPTLYFNWRRGGDVYFTGYRRDIDSFPEDLWVQLPARQKKDAEPKMITWLPIEGKEALAFRDLVTRPVIEIARQRKRQPSTER